MTIDVPVGYGFGGTMQANLREDVLLVQFMLKTLFERGFKGLALGSTPTVDGVFGMKTHYLGRLHEEVSLALLYSAANLFVAPSIQENLSNTVMEALACGTPCIAFDIGGMPDMIEHRRNGYLARPFDAADLAEGIRWILEDDQRRKELSSRARQKVLDEFAMPVVARRHLELYRRILEPLEHQASPQSSGILR
jgi:glycosyltransferase involved in cell wall biosynthesis